MELLDVYDSNGQKTGKTIDRKDKATKLNQDEHIAVAVIFIENSNGEFLIQKTSKQKGDCFSSTGGHVDSGETPLQAIKREVKEELGVNIDSDDINDFGFLLYDMPLRFLFHIKKDIKTSEVKLQKEEVEFVEYMSIAKIKELIQTQKMLKSHGILFCELLKKLNIE